MINTSQTNVEMSERERRMRRIMWTYVCVGGNVTLPPTPSHMTTHTLPTPSPLPPLSLPTESLQFCKCPFLFQRMHTWVHHHMHSVVYTAMQPMRCLQSSKQINCSGVHCVHEGNESLLAHDKRCWRSTKEDVILRHVQITRTVTQRITVQAFPVCLREHTRAYSLCTPPQKNTETIHK